MMGFSAIRDSGFVWFVAVVVAAVVILVDLILSNHAKEYAMGLRNFVKEGWSAGLLAYDVFWNEPRGNPIPCMAGGIFGFDDPRTG